MRLEYESVAELSRDVLRIIGGHLDLSVYEVFFFGSRVAGSASPRSDIDVGIRGPRAIPIEIMSDIREGIGDLPILYKIDIVDFQKTSADFRAVALRHIEPLTGVSSRSASR